MWQAEPPGRAGPVATAGAGSIALVTQDPAAARTPAAAAGAPPPALPGPPRWLRWSFLATTEAVHRLGPWRYRVADLAGTATFACQPGRARRTAATYRLTLPGLDRRAAREMARRSFREYARTAIDFLWVQGLPRHQVLAAVRVAGRHHAERAAAQGRGGIMVLVHQGSWDVPGPVASALGFHVTAVMDAGGSRALTDLVRWARARIAVPVVLPDAAARTLLRVLRRGDWVALLADIPGDTPHVTVPFLGQRARFSAAAGLLAARSGAPLLPITCVRRPSGGYLLEAHPPVWVAPDTPPAAALLPLLPIFEASIRRHPEQWFPFDADRLLPPAGG